MPLIFGVIIVLIGLGSSGCATFKPQSEGFHAYSLKVVDRAPASDLPDSNVYTATALETSGSISPDQTLDVLSTLDATTPEPCDEGNAE